MAPVIGSSALDPEYQKKLELAKAFLEKSVSAEKISGILDGIKLARPVEVVDVPAGTILQRTSKGKDLNPDGCFFTEPGTSEKKLGILDIATYNKVVRDRDFFVTTRAFEALKSTASDYSKPAKDFNGAGLLYEGGGTQYFVPAKDLGAIERVVLAPTLDQLKQAEAKLHEQLQAKQNQEKQQKKDQEQSR